MKKHRSFFLFLIFSVLSFTLSASDIDLKTAQKRFLGNNWTSIHQQAFLVGKNGFYGYLGVNPVTEGSYQYAFFAHKDSFNEKTALEQTSKFSLIENEDKTFSIKCENGVTSFLAFKPIYQSPFNALNYQEAIFASESYLKDRGYNTKFVIFRFKGNYFIHSFVDPNICLAFGPIGKGSWQSAYFANMSYIDGRNHTAALTLNHNFTKMIKECPLPFDGF